MTSKYNTESQQSKFKQLWLKLFFPLDKVINWYSEGGLYQFSPTKYQDIEKILQDSEPFSILNTNKLLGICGLSQFWYPEAQEHNDLQC